MGMAAYDGWRQHTARTHIPESQYSAALWLPATSPSPAFLYCIFCFFPKKKRARRFTSLFRKHTTRRPRPRGSSSASSPITPPMSILMSNPHTTAGHAVDPPPPAALLLALGISPASFPCNATCPLFVRKKEVAWSAHSRYGCIERKCHRHHSVLREEEAGPKSGGRRRQERVAP